MAPGFDSLKTALADRYQIERELGQGEGVMFLIPRLGVRGVVLPHVRL